MQICFFFLFQVDRGVTLSEALLRHDKWLEKKGIKNTNFAVVTWSSWDCRVMLESECRYKKIRKPPYFNRYVCIFILCVLNLSLFFCFWGVNFRNIFQLDQLEGSFWRGFWRREVQFERCGPNGWLSMAGPCSLWSG